MDQAVNSEKTVKSFNKIYRDLQKDMMKALKKGNDKIHTIKRLAQVEGFASQINENSSLFSAQDTELFERVFLLKRVFFGKPKLSTQNNLVAWKYIAVLHGIATGAELSQALVTVETGASDPVAGVGDALKSLGISPGQMKGLVEELTNGKNKGLQALVSDLTAQFANLGEVDPQEILKTILNPETRGENDLGIDFNKILASTQQKIANGEIDVSGITSKIASLHGK
jgi:uncharacterized membrane protein YdfJ with MMPL/SSD domain